MNYSAIMWNLFFVYLGILAIAALRLVWEAGSYFEEAESWFEEVKKNGLKLKFDSLNVNFGSLSAPSPEPQPEAKKLPKKVSNHGKK